MRLVKFEDTAGEVWLINPDQVTHVTGVFTNDHLTDIYLVGPKAVEVVCPVQDVARKLAGET